MSELRLGGGTYPALGIHVPQPEAGGSALGMMGQFADIQNRINQNLMFQQSWKARAAAGEVLAQHPGDPDSALQEMFSRPDIAPWAPQIGNEIMQMRNTTATYQGQLRTQTQDALQAVMKNSAALYGHPELWPTIVSQAQAVSTPQTWPRISQAMESMRKSLIESTNPDGSTRQSTPEEYQSKMAALMLPHIDAGQYAAAVGEPEFLQQGQYAYPYLRRPGAMPGTAAAPFGPGVQMGIPPSVQRVGDIPTAVPGYTPGTGAPNLRPGGALTAGPGVPTDLVAPVAGTFGGTPPMVSPNIGTSNLIPGAPLLTPPQAQTAHGLSEEYATEGGKQFRNMQMSMGSLQMMDAAFDNLARGDQGIVGLGTGAEARLAFAKAVNTISGIFGGQPIFDPTKVASAQELIKETKRMGVQVTNQFLGAGREAASTIQNITSSVPGIENTYMGGKLIISGIREMLQRGMDLRNFQNQWQQDPRNAGNLTGSEEAFNALHPAEAYANRALGEMGMLPNGKFASVQSLENGVMMGYLTPKQAAEFRRQQFPDAQLPGARQ